MDIIDKLKGNVMRIFIVFFISIFVAGCGQSGPNKKEIISYIERHEVNSNLYTITSLKYKNFPNKQGGGLGRVSVSGTIKLTKDLYESKKPTEYKNKIERLMSEQGFTKPEIGMIVYQGIIKKSYSGRGNWKNFVRKVHSSGSELNFSGKLNYQEEVDRHVFSSFGSSINAHWFAGQSIDSFKNPIIDHTTLVSNTLKKLVDEKSRITKALERQKQSLGSLWNNKHGFVIENKKTPVGLDDGFRGKYAAKYLSLIRGWRGIYFVTDVKPITITEQSKLYQLGEYTTSGKATCLRPTGFLTGYNGLSYGRKSISSCEYGETYPIEIKLSSEFNFKKAVFHTYVQFAANNTGSKRLWSDGKIFYKTDTPFSQYHTSNTKINFLKQPFDIKQHVKPRFVDPSRSIHGLKDFKLDYTQVDIAPTTTSHVVKPDNFTPENKVVNTSNVQQSISKVETTIQKSQQQLVISVQTELKRLGLYHSTIDGVQGAGTSRAVLSYQERMGLTKTGVINDDLVQRMRGTPKDAFAPKERYSHTIESGNSSQKTSVSASAEHIPIYTPQPTESSGSSQHQSASPREKKTLGRVVADEVKLGLERLFKDMRSQPNQDIEPSEEEYSD